MTVRKLVIGLVGVVALLACGAGAAAQEATERYVPVGRSPGLSGKYTIVGQIEAVRARAQTIAIAGPAGKWSAEITPRTKIWFDRSQLRQANVTGTFTDLRQGLTVEVKPEDHTRKTAGGPAEWVKVQVPASR